MKKEMLINVLQPEECRIAIVEDGVLEELYVERANQESYVGNIYKGRIVNIEPSIQAVFVDFGIGRNGFLHVSDVDPAYYKHLLPKELLAELEAEENGEPRRDRGSSSGRDRNEDRGDRGRNRDRDRDRDTRGREPMRVTEPESAVTIPATPRVDSAPVAYQVESEDEDDGFGEGLGDDIDLSLSSETPPPLPVESPPLPVSHDIEDDDPLEAEFTDTEILVARPTIPEVIELESVEDEFGAGLDFEEVASLTVVMPGVSGTPSRTETPTGEPEQVSTPEIEAVPGVETQSDPEPEKPAKSRGRGRARSKKADADDTGEGETKKAKPRRTRKKAEADAEPTEPGNDDKPLPMPGSERRTSPDDEPEIQPFFDGAGVDENFDIDGPNDRFAQTGDKNEEGNGNDEEGEFGYAETEEDETPTQSASEPTEPDDDEFHYVPRKSDDDDSGRGRGRGRSRGRSSGGGGNGGGRNGGSRNGGSGGSRGNGNGSASRDRGYPRIPIQDIFKRGQEVIVQVIKEGIGTKGPTLSTFISIAGRYLVLMPSLNRVGVSRKIEDIDSRRRLRDIMTKLNPPKGVGFIVRTAAIDRNEHELQNDLAYLLRLWQVVVRRLKRMPSPVEIYRESDMITRTIRDIFTADIDTIWVDEENAYSHASEFLQIVMPRYADRIRYHSESEPLFNKYRVEDEIAKINHKRIDLPQGGSIIIEQTEALVAIDVNSGNFRAENNAEETAYQMNLIAAKEIARQLRLRDLGGVIVNDFIDMREDKHRRNVENVLRTALERDRARTKVLRISQFGIIEMTRQRMQQSLKKRIYSDCPHCKGTGFVKTSETMGIEVMRLLQLAACRTPSISNITVTVHTDAAFHLLNRKRREMAKLEESSRMEIQINGVGGVSPDHMEFRCLDSNGNDVRLFAPPAPRVLRPGSGGGGDGRRNHHDRRN